MRKSRHINRQFLLKTVALCYSRDRKEVLLMDQEKIGKFIASCRKEQGLTQATLAEKLGITDRAVSKWETGRCLPDASSMPELCDLLKINLNELFSGERITMEHSKEVSDNLLLEMKMQEEAASKRILYLKKALVKKHFQILLAIALAAIVFEVLPFGVKLCFGNPDGSTYFATYSYFSFTPYGYASFSQLPTAWLTVAAVVLVAVGYFTARPSLMRACAIVCTVAFPLSLIPFFDGSYTWISAAVAAFLCGAAIYGFFGHKRCKA